MKRFLICLIILMTATMLIACNEKLDDYTFEEVETVINIRYPGMSSLDLPFQLNSVNYGNEYVDFYADDYMSRHTLNRVATFTIQVLELIKPSEKITCYVSKRLPTMPDYDRHIMYLNEFDVKSYEHLVVTVTAAFGGKLPFGLVYGIAKRINDDLNFRASFPSASERKIKALLTKNPDLFEMQASEFYDDTSENVKAAKGAALAFCDFIESKEDLIELSKSLTIGDERLEKYKDEWAASLGLTRDNDPVMCALTYFDDADEVIVRTEYADIAIANDYIDAYQYYYGNDFYDYEKTYSGMKDFLRPVLSDMAACQDDIPKTREIPFIKFGNSNEAHTSDSDCYVTSMSTIFQIYLAYRLNMGNTQFERKPYINEIISYLIYRYCESNLFAEKYLTEMGLKWSETLMNILDSIKQKYPDAIDNLFRDADGYRNACKLLYYKEAMEYEYAAFSEKTLNLSFTIYLCENYGLETLYKLADGKSFEDVFSKSASELADEWEKYNISLWE